MNDVRKINGFSLRSHEIFEVYQDDINARTLKLVMVVALVFELFQIFLGNYFTDTGFYYTEAHLTLSTLNVITVHIYLVLFLLIQFIYKRFPELISIIVIGFTLSHQIHCFLQRPVIWINLIFWGILALMTAWQFIGPGISIPLIVVSYIWFIFGMYVYKVPISNYAPFIWLLFLIVVVAGIFSVLRLKKANSEYSYRTYLNANYADYDKKLNYDELTGLHTNYALENFIVNFEPSGTGEKILILILDLDNTKVCNSLYGRKAGDAYLQTFANIIRFLVKDSRDIVARVSGDVFIGILTSYSDEAELEKRLERYNHLLREEFDKGHGNRSFLPWFSYGMVTAKDLKQYSDLLNEAELRMFQMKEDNRRYTLTHNRLYSEINYLSLFSESNITVFVWMPTEGWPVCFVTDNVYELMGYPKEEFMNKETLYKAFIHPEDLPMVINKVNSYLNEKKIHFELVYRIRKYSGDYIWIREYNVPLWRNGVLLQINSYIYDISEEITTKDQLKEQERKFEDIIEATNVGTWEWHIPSGSVKINRRYAQMLGYDYEELVPMTIEDSTNSVHPDERKEAYGLKLKHLRGESSSYQIETRIHCKDGSWLWTLDRGKVMKRTDDGSPEIMVGALYDITDMKEAESRLRQSEKLSAVGRMAGGIAHDMNNLLMMMGGFVGLAQEKDSLEDYRESYTAIDGLITRASDTVCQIMSFTRHHIYDPQPIDLRSVLGEMANMIDRTFEKDICLECDITELPLMIRGEQALIDNALLNLCINARDAMEKGGRLRLGLTRVIFTEELRTLTGSLPSGDYARISVVDEGTGIPEEDLDRIFEPFFTTKQSGGGIGLSMVVSVVKEHGGDLTVKTQKGVGTTFCLYFPLINADIERTESVEVKQQLAAKERQFISEDQNLRVMIVDDEPVLTEVLLAFFEEKGWQATAFIEPLEAVRYYEKHYDRVDVVLLDMLMPGMTGTELFDRLIEVNDEVRVLYLSGYSDGIEMKDETRNNVMGFLKKPVRLNEVYDILQKI